MTIKDETTIPTGLTVVFETDSGKHGIYGDYFLLEKKVDENWLQVSTIIDDYGFNDIGYDLAPADIQELSIDWEWLYGSLDTGEYRIIKDIFDFRKQEILINIM